MRSPAEIKSLIEARLKTYLSRDTTGIRREMLKLFLKIKSLTIADAAKVRCLGSGTTIVHPASALAIRARWRTTR